jgi:F-type H+-transporting ATPase subunit delta
MMSEVNAFGMAGKRPFAMLHRRFPCVSTRPIFAGAGGRTFLREKPLHVQGLGAPSEDGAGLTDLPEKTAVAGEDPITSGMAGRYATALFELALEQKAVDAVKGDLERFDALIAGSEDLRRLVRSPVFGAEEQARALAAVLEKAGIGGLAANFLLLVVRNRRLFAVRNMIRAYRALVARHKGEVTAQVTVAQALSDAHLAALKDALKSVTKQEVEVDLTVDPAIIGGLVVKVGSRMVDSSLRTKLNAIRFAMKEAR